MSSIVIGWWSVPWNDRHSLPAKPLSFSITYTAQCTVSPLNPRFAPFIGFLLKRPRGFLRIALLISHKQETFIQAVAQGGQYFELYPGTTGKYARLSGLPQQWKARGHAQADQICRESGHRGRHRSVGSFRKTKPY